MSEVESLKGDILQSCGNDELRLLWNDDLIRRWILPRLCQIRQCPRPAAAGAGRRIGAPVYIPLPWRGQRFLHILYEISVPRHKAVQTVLLERRAREVGDAIGGVDGLQPHAAHRP